MRTRIRDWALNSVAVVVTLMAIAVAVVRVQSARSAASETASASRKVADWRSYQKSGHRIGSPSAQVDIVIFSDFQCPYCRETENTLEALQRRFPDRIGILYRHFPLRAHRYAVAAAQAADCAAASGRFREMHDQLFKSQDSLGSIAWTTLAKRAGVLDTTTFARCMTVDPLSQGFHHDTADGHRLRLDGTPAVLVGERLFIGTPDSTELSEAISSAIKSSLR